MYSPISRLHVRSPSYVWRSKTFENFFVCDSWYFSSYRLKGKCLKQCFLFQVIPNNVSGNSFERKKRFAMIREKFVSPCRKKLNKFVFIRRRENHYVRPQFIQSTFFIANDVTYFHLFLPTSVCCNIIKFSISWL